MKIYNHLFETLYSSIKEDIDEWKLSKHRLTHKTGLSLWISNGADYLEITEPEEIKCFGFWQKRKLWSIIRKLQKEWEKKEEIRKRELLNELITKLV